MCVMVVDGHRIHPVRHFLSCAYVSCLHAHLHHMHATGPCHQIPWNWICRWLLWEVAVTWSMKPIDPFENSNWSPSSQGKTLQTIPFHFTRYARLLRPLLLCSQHACHSTLVHYLPFNFFDVRNGLELNCGSGNYLIPELRTVKILGSLCIKKSNLSQVRT